ncbi:hypothetical protein [Lacrimispora indolis]|uniref:hypothetical protein n=1 Tax=Lacrimispora indolis TaxID=69825 RepID=UPI0004626FD5|nr:hypothetical protein [[Clostridium] methoxybenzovorans]
MSKELTIKGIKNDIIDKLLDSTYIVGLFDLKGYGLKSISEIKDTFIFDYAKIKSRDFISIDVSKIRTPNQTLVSGGTSSAFYVSIMFGLNCVTRNNENRLDNISEVIEGIIQELYPCNRNYKDIFSLQNVPSFTDGCHLTLVRTITFTVE